MNLWIDRLESELGPLTIGADGENLCLLEFSGSEARLNAYLKKRFGSVRVCEADDPLGVTSRLRAYLNGDPQALDDIPVRTGGTPFQERVWSALRTIPIGTTLSYGRLAAKLGQPTASRAVGLANGLNPVVIVVPCHRVIGANESLTGYGGGLERKRWLLEHERAMVGLPLRG
jgi:methylated-DNA-[protein]-cysteine S-methyltransferase